MDITTATAILGVSPQANRAQIEAAYAREYDRRREQGDGYGRLDEACDLLLANLSPVITAEEGKVVVVPPEPPRARRPIVLAILVMLLPLPLLLAGLLLLFNGLKDTQSQILALVFGLLVLPIAGFYQHALRRAFPLERPIGGWALGIAGAGELAGFTGFAEPGLIALAVGGTIAIGSAVRTLSRRRSRPAP